MDDGLSDEPIGGWMDGQVGTRLKRQVNGLV